MSQEFIREVDEDLQRDRLLALARRWGPLAAVLVIALVGAVAGKVGWDWWAARQADAAAARIEQAEALARSGKLEDAATALAAIAKETSAGPSALARLREAEALAASGKDADAVSAYRALAGDPEADPVLRALARLGAIAREIDTGDPAALVDELEAASAAGEPFRFTALELLATLRLRTGDRAAALTALEEIENDATTPPSLRGRVAELRAALGGSGA